MNQTTAIKPRVSDAEIFRATRTCIDRSGAEKFTMAEVAAEAGLTRVQIYNRFGNRQQLVLSLLASHATTFADHLAPKLDAAPTSAEAIRIGMMAAIRAARSDRYFGMLVLPATAGASRIDGAPELALELSRKLWTPVIKAGLQAGELHSTLSAAKIAHWIGLTELSLFNASQSFGLSDAECKSYIDTFIIGALAHGEIAS